MREIQKNIIILFFSSIFFLFLFLSQNLYSQREADRWYFAYHCGLDFNSGIPEVIHDGRTYIPFSGVGTMCDSIGNLLFYSHPDTIYTSQHTLMENGYDFEDGCGWQSNLIVPWPESDSLYFVFKTPNLGDGWGLHYNIIDISKNNGLGAVIEKDILLEYAWDAADHLTSTLHKNKRDVWIITRKFLEDSYAVFLITPDGINETPLLFPAPDRIGQDSERGYMKISYDKKYLFTNYYSPYGTEICEFNSGTGEIEFLYELNIGRPPVGLEFSPDSKFAYISYWESFQVRVKQFKMEYVNIMWQFIQTHIEVGTGNGKGLQLATDGKIYCSYASSGSPEYFIGIIHKPWELGTNCQFETQAINMYPGETSSSMPNILMDYLYRFEFEGTCEGEPFQFTSNFNPVPDSIRWFFSDFNSGTNNVSNDLNPIHIFSDGGIYEVKVDVWYPSGRFEHTSREVEVEYAPEPDLGPDTTICNGQEVILDAECGPHFYSWSTGAFGSSQITVSDTGWYWVKVTSNAGCFEIDSVHILFYPPAIADTSNLIISPTTCGGSMGVICGLEVSGNPPFLYQWINDLGNPVANTLDIFHLPVGNYTLQVIDGNDCLTEFGPYSIIDTGDVLIEDVNYTHEHCGQQDASIIITATSGLGDMLFYSIDNGSTYFTNQGIFMGLAAGTYAVRVKDSTDCQDVYINNPIILENISGPQVTDIQITPSSNGQNNGAINIIASGNTDTLFYSNDNGANFQINNGLFISLFPGYYTCIVMDEFGCDTTFIVEVTEEITIHLEAIAGDDEVCPGNSAFVPLIVSNFNDVANFKTTLVYNKDLITCAGFANAHPQLEDSLNALLFPAEGRIELNWSSVAVTLADNTIMADLVFESIDPGMSLIEWDGSPGASLFQNSTGLTIPVDYFIGIVKIYKEVSFSFWGTNEFCEGETMELEPIVWSSNGDVTYLWTDPNGDTSSYEIMTINNIQINQSGTYSLTVTDTLDCKADASVVVIVYPTPIPAFAGQDTIFTEVPVDIDAGAVFLYYLWNTGDTTQIITVQNNGWYSVEIESQQGCMGGDSVFVLFSTPPEPIPDIRIYLPNAFSPDSDGLNDEFKAVTNSENIKSFQMLIYDRWGTLIFESNNISKGWNGTFKGKLCQQGVYVYKIEYSLFASSTGQSETKIGTVVLVR